ncbi:MAG: asparagine synthase-related protein, partial [bacterium]
FDLPLSDWLRGPWREPVRDLLLGRRCRERGFLNPSQVEKIVQGHLDGTRDSTQQLWELVVLEQWCRLFLDKSA